MSFSVRVPKKMASCMRSGGDLPLDNPDTDQAPSWLPESANSVAFSKDQKELLIREGASLAPGGMGGKLVSAYLVAHGPVQAAASDWSLPSVQWLRPAS